MQARPDPLIVAVDGAVATGKTTLINGALRTMEGTSAIPEHSHFLATASGHLASRSRHGGATRPAARRSARRSQAAYLRAERRRIRAISSPPSAEVRLLMLDRSILSQAAHVHALAAHGCDIRRWFLHQLRDRPETRLLVPDLWVAVSCEHREADQRLAARESGTAREGTIAELSAKGYRHDFEAFLRRWSAHVGSGACRALDSSAEPVTVLAVLNDLVTTMVAPARPAPATVVSWLHAVLLDSRAA